MFSTQKEGRDVLGTFLNVVVCLFAFYPIFLVGLGVLFELDPLSLVDRYLLDSNLSSKKALQAGNWTKCFVSFTLKFVSTLIPCHLTCRMLSLVICFTTMMADVAITNMASLHGNSDTIGSLSYARLNQYLAKYHGMEILFAIASDYTGLIVAGLMFMGFISSIGFNFATLKLYHIIPMPLFLFFPTVSVLIPSTIHFMLKMGIQIHTIAYDMVEIKWRRVIALGRGSRKYVKKRIQATRVIRIHGGFPGFLGLHGFKVYDLTKATKSVYYEAILDHTMIALLSIDTSGMKPVQL
jgi:hypothetical protein